MLLNFFTFVECNLLVPLFVLVLFPHPSKLHRLGNFSLGFGTCEFQRLFIVWIGVFTVMWRLIGVYSIVLVQNTVSLNHVVFRFFFFFFVFLF